MATILLLEDHNETRKVVAQILGFNGHTVELAESAEHALEIMAVRVPDAIIADQRLPGISGLAFLNRLRASAVFAAIPVVICSGDDSERDAALSAGAADFWVKGTDGMFQAIASLGEKLGSGSI